MGRTIADALGGDLDVVLVRKIGAPGNPEYAIGAVDEAGVVHMNADSGYAADDPYVRQEAHRQLRDIRDRRARIAPGRTPADPAGRTVIVVDDGSATGATMIAALRAVRSRNPAHLIAAAAVAPPDAVRRIAQAADATVVLETPAHFGAVSAFFEDFSQVSDNDVLASLAQGA